VTRRGTARHTGLPAGGSWLQICCTRRELHAGKNRKFLKRMALPTGVEPVFQLEKPARAQQFQGPFRLLPLCSRPGASKTSARVGMGRPPAAWSAGSLRHPAGFPQRKMAPSTASARRTRSPVTAMSSTGGRLRKSGSGRGRKGKLAPDGRPEGEREERQDYPARVTRSGGCGTSGSHYSGESRF
jgi:hypothetical protein